MNIRHLCQRTGCFKKFYARCDAKYCSEKCRSKERHENNRFNAPKSAILHSGVPGVTWCRSFHRWRVKIKLNDGTWKYVGSFKNLADAIEYQKQIYGVATDIKSNAQKTNLSS